MDPRLRHSYKRHNATMIALEALMRESPMSAIKATILVLERDPLRDTGDMEVAQMAIDELRALAACEVDSRQAAKREGR